jgi:chromosome segregation protein
MLEMQNDYDGFIHGVKEILKVKNKPDVLRGIHGAVAELVRVPAEVEIAVETALGGALQNIVVATEGDGRAAIAFLKRRQLGRATFLPLDVIRGRDIPEQDKRLVMHSQGFVGVAADLVQFDAPYRQIVYSLLGNVLIAETLEQANHIAAQCRYRYRVVTLEGDVVNPGGSMTGGSQHKKTVSLLGRKRQIDELEQEIADSRQQQAQLFEKSKQLKQSLNELTAKLESLRQAGEQKRIEEQQLRAQIEPLKQELQALRDQSELSASDREALEQEQQELRDKCEQCQTELVSLQQQESLLQQQIREAEDSRRSRETQKEELQTQLTDLKIEEASAQSFGQSLSEQRRRLRSDLDGIALEEEQVKQSMADAVKEAADTELERTRQIEQWNELTILKRDCAEKIEFQRADRAKRAAELQAAEDETKDERQALRQTEEKLHQTEVQVARLDVELDNLLRKLAEDYELSVELARSRYPIPQDPSATQSLVKELRREIASLGSVNLGAIEEYARVGERFTFLSSQKNDLMEAKAALYEVIGEMDEEMSRRFLQTFEAVREQFVLVFSKLFGGGRADLILSEPQRLLATGIEIVAQPPGKKLQNLQLLSGGERALTAIALLFAILRIKPVPFCVLDEVEAALDEANVTRFAEYLREFSMETQFIVVTHRKGTMEEADVLYGVTMEEGGVSKLVSVRLDDEAGLESA